MCSATLLRNSCCRETRGHTSSGTHMWEGVKVELHLAACSAGFTILMPV